MSSYSPRLNWRVFQSSNRLIFLVRKIGRILRQDAAFAVSGGNSPLTCGRTSLSLDIGPLFCQVGSKPAEGVNDYPDVPFILVVQ